MKRLLTPLLMISLLFCLSAANPPRSQAQTDATVWVDLNVPLAPTPVLANGKRQLLYEIHITNFDANQLTLTRLEVLKEGKNAHLLAVYQDAELMKLLEHYGVSAELADKRTIGNGLRVVAFMQISIEADTPLPDALYHRLFFTLANGDKGVVEGAQVMVQHGAPPLISSPLRGEGWLAMNGLSNTSEHRRALLPVHGKAQIAQRFAIDWVKIGANGQIFHDDPAKNTNWYGYGTEVLAVADAVVVGSKDGIPENVPLTGQFAVPITLETIGGNYVLLDLGSDHFAFYAHLQPQSLRVKVGDKVRQGQVLGLLGNSGNSDAPHLHFHIANANSPLDAEGAPYVLPAFGVQGVVNTLDVFEQGQGWKPNATVEQHRLELPVENVVVRFPS